MPPPCSSNNSFAHSSSIRFLASSRTRSASSSSSRNIRCVSALATWPNAPRRRGVFRYSVTCWGANMALISATKGGRACRHAPFVSATSRKCLSPCTVRLGDLKEVQKLLADQVAHRLLRPEAFEDVAGSITLRFDELGGAHNCPRRLPPDSVARAMSRRCHARVLHGKIHAGRKASSPGTVLALRPRLPF